MNHANEYIRRVILKSVDLRQTWIELEAGTKTGTLLPSTGRWQVWATVTEEPHRWHLEIRGPYRKHDTPFPSDYESLEVTCVEGKECKVSFDPSAFESRKIWPHFAEEMLNELEKEPNQPARAIVKCFKDWSPHWPRKTKKLTSPQVLQGIFGELWLLKWLMEKDILVAGALRAWQGCAARPHDFQFDKIHVEVKSKVGRSREIQIADLRQMDHCGADQLFLAFLVLHAVERKDASLAALAEDLQTRMTEDEIREFHTKLRMLRWFQIPAELRNETRFHAASLEFFLVTEDFPRLVKRPANTPKAFPPKGVLVKKYKICVPDIDHGSNTDALDVIEFIQDDLEDL